MKRLLEGFGGRSLSPAKRKAKSHNWKSQKDFIIEKLRRENGVLRWKMSRKGKTEPKDPFDIIDYAVINEWHVTDVNSFFGKKRGTKDVCFARQIAMCLCCELLERPLDVIGKHYNDRDHTTVTHARKVVEEQIESNPALNKKYQNLYRSLAVHLKVPPKPVKVCPEPESEQALDYVI